MNVLSLDGAGATLVDAPLFQKQIATTLPQNVIEPWKAYFEAHLLRARAAQLPDAFENESFEFWGRYLTGVKEQRPRQFRCV